MLHVKTLIALHQATGGTAERAGDPAKATGDVSPRRRCTTTTNQQLLAAGTEVKAATIDTAARDDTIGSIMKTWEDAKPARGRPQGARDEHDASCGTPA